MDSQNGQITFIFEAIIKLFKQPVETKKKMGIEIKDMQVLNNKVYKLNLC